jgi:predicted permease
MRTLWTRVVATVRRHKAERDLEDEVQFHLKMLADEFEAQGMSPGDARLAARRSFGGVEQVKEMYRERRGLPLVESLLQDLRHVIRALIRSPGFAIVVVATLGLSIGANAAVFSLIDQIVLRPLPVAKPAELVIVSIPPLPIDATRGLLGVGRGPGGQLIWSASYPLYETLRNRVPLFQGVLGHLFFRPTIAIGATPEQATGELVTGNYFDLLGIKAAVGRTLRPADDHLPIGQPVVVLAHGFWQRRFGGDASVVGRVIRVNNFPLTVVGVAAPDFSGTVSGRSPDLFVPVTMSNQVAPRRGYDMLSREVGYLAMMARLAPGVSREQAERFVGGIYEVLVTEAVGRLVKKPDIARLKARPQRVLLLPGGYVSSQQSSVSMELTRTLELLMAMVALVLLTAASNVTNLFVARGAVRARDVAIRLAMGATRWRLLQERLVESLVLALGAGATSLFVAEWIVKVLPLVLPLGDRAASLAVALDRRATVFTFLVTVGTALYLWLTTAPQVTRRCSLPPLAGGGSGHSVTRPLRLRRGLVVVQMALSLLLLCASMLLAHSLYNLMTVDPGFEVEGLSAFSVQLPSTSETPDRATPLLQQLLEDLGGLPGVRAASMSDHLPFTGGRGETPVAGGPEARDVSKPIWAEANLVGPGYFRTIGMPLVQGRDFTWQDDASAAKVAVVNESLALALFGSTHVVGQVVGYEEPPRDLLVVGVVRDARSGPRTSVRPSIYVPCFQQSGPATMTIVARTAGRKTLTNDVVRNLLKRTAPSVAMSDLKAMTDRIAETLLRDRMVAMLSLCFAALATLLGGIGLSGLTSFTVARRSHEIGVRMALGAGRRSIKWMVVKEVAVLTAVGSAAGLVIYLGVSRVVGSFLFELSPTDPPTVAAATVILAAVALSAGYRPARKAARLDPALTLRNE